MSGQPSRSSSMSATPSAFDVESKIPHVAVTSSNVPLPRLRKSQDVSPRYASGVQYDFCFPSRLQKTSPSADHLTWLQTNRSSRPSRSTSTHIADVLKALRPPRPLRVVTSRNVPLPVLRNRRFWPTPVTNTSGNPSLLKSPTATPIPYISTSSPAARVTSVKVPLRLFRYRRSVDRCFWWPGQSAPLTSRMSCQP